MPRDLVFGNGQFLVNLDSHLNIRDVFYPFVGQMNHVGGHSCRIGVWTSDVGFAWLGEEWHRELSYHGDSLVSDCTLKHHRLGLTLHFRQGVSATDSVFCQKITIVNHWKADRIVRLFFAFDFRIDESDIGDAVFYNPYSCSLIHYKRDRYMLTSGYVGNKVAVLDSLCGIAHYACGVKEFGGAEGTWRDAEDGQLSGNSIAQGSVDSVIGFNIDLEPEGKSFLRTWLLAAPDLHSATKLHDKVLAEGVDSILDVAEKTSKGWASLSPKGLVKLPDRIKTMFRRSLLMMRTHIDEHGAVIASSDSDIMQTARAHYAYVWPRDGALAAHPLDRLGLYEITKPFYKFCCDALAVSPMRLGSGSSQAAALMHKYCPDGTLGASWHQWVVSPDGREIPIQEDGTALVVWSASQHARHGDRTEWTSEIYERLILPGARFLVEHRHPKLHLPLPSWDIWEERRGIHLYTTCGVIAALKEAAELAAELGDSANCKRFRNAAKQTTQALEQHFWSDEHQRFARTMNFEGTSSTLSKDFTADSSMFALFGFNVMPTDHPKVVATMSALGHLLWVKVGIGGLARYENDYYFRDEKAGDVTKVPGNPWIICTLWLAEWMIATADNHTELEAALDLLEWVTTCALATGILPEQIHPVTHAPLSVAPLTWSHAQFVTTVLNYLERWGALGT